MVEVIVMQKSLSKIKSLWICCALKEYCSFIIVSIAITFLTVLEKKMPYQSHLTKEKLVLVYNMREFRPVWQTRHGQRSIRQMLQSLLSESREWMMSVSIPSAFDPFYSILYPRYGLCYSQSECVFPHLPNLSENSLLDTCRGVS